MKTNHSKNYRINSFIQFGILPEVVSEYTDHHRMILDEINTSKKSIDSLLGQYINEANTLGKQFYIFRKIKQKKYMRSDVGVDPNLRPEDIIINEYCPFFNTKIDYRPKLKNNLTKFNYSVDRIDNSKMYMKGNIWIISRFANTMKNDSSLHELKTFSVNVLKQVLTNKGVVV